MTRYFLSVIGFAILASQVLRASDQKVAIRFQAMVGKEKFACGQTYDGIGTTRSRISPRDFRFYVHNVRLLDKAGHEVPVELEQDGKWQLDDVALLDFENATGACINGTPETNDRVIGTVPVGRYKGLRFTVGVPFNKNHTELTAQPPPLNLTALFWVWNAGHKFVRIDFASTGQPRGYAIHVGSTGCTPNPTVITVPTQCSAPNRLEVEISGFEPTKDVVLADLAALLKDSNVDVIEEKKEKVAEEKKIVVVRGCMSGADDSDCAPIFANFGLPFGGKAAGRQNFFRKANASDMSSVTRAAQ